MPELCYMCVDVSNYSICVLMCRIMLYVCDVSNYVMPVWGQTISVCYVMNYLDYVLNLFPCTASSLVEVLTIFYMC